MDREREEKQVMQNSILPHNLVVHVGVFLQRFLLEEAGDDDDDHVRQ
jgi:hypothetical protein